jgi:hypothetical protein
MAQDEGIHVQVFYPVGVDRVIYKVSYKVEGSKKRVFVEKMSPAGLTEPLNQTEQAYITLAEHNKFVPGRSVIVNFEGETVTPPLLAICINVTTATLFLKNEIRGDVQTRTELERIGADHPCFKLLDGAVEGSGPKPQAVVQR